MVLGMRWNPASDMLGFQFPQLSEKPSITKRTLLSLVQQIFDHLGLMSPITIEPKLLIQKAWLLKQDCDDPLEDYFKQEFLAWWEQLHLLDGLVIPRWVATLHTVSVIRQLHVFCDASQTAYAAAIYLRISGEKETSVTLLMALSRVSPKRILTIPRFELMAYLIGTRLSIHILESLTETIDKVYYWTDSTAALAWIKREDIWRTFVKNRVKEIQQNTSIEQWCHLLGEQNTADLPSRGCSILQFLKLKWWKGSAWLKDERSWIEPVEDVLNILSEKKKTTLVIVSSQVEEPHWYLRSSNNYWKNVRVLSWVLRAINSFKRITTSIQEDITFEELQTAERLMLKFVQIEKSLKNIKWSKDLHVFTDEDGILRVKSWLYDEDYYNFQAPVLLPKSHPLIDQLIMHEHIVAYHAGTQILLGILRERFWVLQGRKTVKRVISKCITCKRFRAKPFQSTLPPLPSDRTTLGKSFEVTGTDLAGPLYLKSGKKCWVVIFTCAVYRCVHLDVVSSMTTNDFLMALSRFVSRRGRPRIIYSDNGSNFVGAVNLFDELDWRKIKRKSDVLRVKWKCNPPTAVWWERLIRMIKDLLRKMLGHKKLTIMQLTSAVTVAEAAINDRPVTYLYESEEDLKPLTPSMFLRETTSSCCPELTLVGANDLRKKYKEFIHLHKELKGRFRKEYLGQLMRGKKYDNEIRIGDVVLIEQDTKNRIHWPVAKIEEIIAGKDGEIRLVKLKTANGQLMRPIQKIYPLEVSSANAKFLML